MKRLFSTLFASACLLGAPAAGAAEFPQKQLRIVVAHLAGGTADLVARTVAQALSERYKQTVVVENRPGAGGNIGAAYVAQSTADGYTMLLGTIGIHAAYAIYSNLQYDPAKDLTVVSVLGELPNVLIASNSMPFKTVKEMVDYAQKHPGEVFFGSAGHGSSTHMAGELFKHVSGAKLDHIPYKGSAGALTDLVGGRIQIMFENFPTALPHMQSNSVRAIGVTSGKRLPSHPDLPTIAEQGQPDYVFNAWMTLAAPSGTPRAVLEKLNQDIAAVVRSPALQKRWEELGIQPVAANLADTEQYVLRERDTFNALIKSAGISVN